MPSQQQKPMNNHIVKLGGKVKLKNNLKEIKMESLIYRGTRSNLQPNKEWCEMLTVQE